MTINNFNLDFNNMPENIVNIIKNFKDDFGELINYQAIDENNNYPSASPISFMFIASKSNPNIGYSYSIKNRIDNTGTFYRDYSFSIINAEKINKNLMYNPITNRLEDLDSKYDDIFKNINKNSTYNPINNKLDNLNSKYDDIFNIINKTYKETI